MHRCKKCSGVIGVTKDGKFICQCEVWPGNTVDYDTGWLKECQDKLGDTTNVKLGSRMIKTIPTIPNYKITDGGKA